MANSSPSRAHGICRRIAVWLGEGAFATWSDCEFISKRARAVQSHRFRITRGTSESDHDLWQMVADLIPGEQICQLHHIRSHQQYADEDEWIQWARSGNDAADQAAEFALSTLPVHVQQLKRQAAHDIQQMNQAIGQIHQHMVRVAKLSVENKEKQIGAHRR